MKARAVAVAMAAVLTSLLTARLGFWQLDRAAQKNALQSAMQQQRDLPTLTQAALAVDAKEARLQLHRAVVLAGTWSAQHTVYLENRQMNARVGFYAVTPLLLDDGSAVLVQRGWLPRDLLDRSRISVAPAPAGVVRLQGRIAPGAARLYEFDATASGPIRQNLDIDFFATETALRLRPLLVVQEDPMAAPASATPEPAASTAAGVWANDGLLRQWPAPAAGVHKHYGYAFQWFSLSALSVGLYVWFQILRPRRRAAVAPS